MRVRKIVGSGLLVVALAVALSGCLSQVGQRRFATSPEPAQTQNDGMTVLDDGSIVFTQDRLEISLKVLRDDFLNRQFAAASSKGAESTNPYTYGDWKPWGPRMDTAAIYRGFAQGKELRVSQSIYRSRRCVS